VDDRHRLGTEVAPAALAGQIRYAGLTAVPFSDAGTILTNLYWHQSFLDNRLAYIVGIVDVTDYVGVYGLVNPWTDFINLAFSTDPTTPAPDQGFGAAVRWNPVEHYYLLAGLADANGNPRDPVDSVDGFFNNGEYFKHIEVGWFGSWESRFDDNIHLTYWHADERTEAGVPDGWGAQFSFSRKLQERWLPFLRIGYAAGAGSPLDRSVSTGFAYSPSSDGSVFGLGINWGRPNRDIFGASTDNQYTLEVYYRFQLFEHLAITPDLQLVQQPAQNPEQDFIWIAGLRARLTF
jgi:porin